MVTGMCKTQALAVGSFLGFLFFQIFQTLSIHLDWMNLPMENLWRQRVKCTQTRSPPTPKQFILFRLNLGFFRQIIFRGCLYFKEWLTASSLVCKQLLTICWRLFPTLCTSCCFYLPCLKNFLLCCFQLEVLFYQPVLFAFHLEMSISSGILCWFPMLLKTCSFKNLCFFPIIFSNLGWEGSWMMVSLPSWLKFLALVLVFYLFLWRKKNSPLFIF